MKKARTRVWSMLLAVAMLLAMTPTVALAAGSETTGAGTIEVGGDTYSSFSEAVNGAEPDENGVITYEISGKVEVSSTEAWIQVLRDDLSNVTAVKFVGVENSNAEICIKNPTSVLADQKYDIDVSFEDLKLSHPNGEWVGDLGHATNYFACVLRNTDAANNTVTYTNCTFPNGVCNNQYGKTVFDNCKFTNTTSGKYNLWNYGGNTEIKNSAFTGTRGIKAYSEGTDGGDITVADTTFTNLTEKAAIVVSKAANVTLNTVDATDCTMGLLQKDIEGSTDGQKVTIEANGTGISGKFNITAEMDAEAAKNEFKISGGTFTSEVEQDYCMDGFEVNAGTDGKYTVAQTNNVAKVGGTGYTTLDAALEALNGTNHTLTLIDGSKWNAATPVYWKAGAESGYVAKLTDALTAAYKANAGNITIVCRPGADVGTMTHGHVADNLTIYGNDAYLSGGECDLEVDTYRFDRTTGAQSDAGAFLSQDITITAYELDNLGVWGQRNTEHTVTVNLIDCDGREISGQSNNQQRVYITGTSGANNITLTDCDFITAATAVYSNADGRITIDGCSFTGGQAPVNFNHKDSGTQTVTVKNSTFTACGDDNTWKTFAAPLRFVNSGNGTMSANVDACTITGTVGSNGDILLGDGRTGEQSNDVTLTVSGTAAEVQAQKPGHYDADGAVSDTSLVRKTSVVNSATPVTITLDSEAFDLAQVGDTGYSNLTDAISAAQSGGKTVTLLTADDVLLQAILDGQYGSIDGLTIELPTGSYGQLELGRATKYAGSKTEYYVGGFDESAANYHKFDSAEALKAYKNGGGWTPSCYYVRNMNDVTLKAAAGADVEIAGMTATAGHIYGTSGAPVTDYVLDTETDSTVDSYYLAQNWGNITFDGLTFTAKVDIASSLEKTAIDGVSFENCNFDINNIESGNQALRYYNELDNEKVSGLTVDNCKFTNCFQGVYTQKIKNITVTNSTFDTTAHNAIAIQSGDNAADHGDVVITNNKFTNIGDRIIRFNNVAEGTNITITDNTATNSGDVNGEVIKATSIAEGVTTTIYSNNWGPGMTVANDEFQDTAAPSSGGSSSYTITTKDTDNGSISVSPSRASSGRTVTITVEPDEGYVLDELTVTDSSGNEIELTKVSDTKYTFTMPRSRVTIEAAFVEINHADVCPSADYTDVDIDAWYHTAIDYAIENGMMNGIGNNLFAPESNLTRAMLVQVLWNLEGNPDTSAITEYSDVASDAWYYNAVQWATAENIVGGYGNGIYGPEDDITREQMALMLYRYAQYKGYDTTQSGADVQGFNDYEDISDWALEGVTWAVNAGLLNGKGNGILDPIGDATRAEVAQILMNFCENIVE